MTMMRKLRTGCGIKERCLDVGIEDFKLKLHCRSMLPTPDFPKGRIYSCDTAEQFGLKASLLGKDHELIGMYIYLVNK